MSEAETARNSRHHGGRAFQRRGRNAGKVVEKSHRWSEAFTEGNMFGREQSRDATDASRDDWHAARNVRQRPVARQHWTKQAKDAWPR